MLGLIINEESAVYGMGWVGEPIMVAIYNVTKFGRFFHRMQMI